MIQNLKQYLTRTALGLIGLLTCLFCVCHLASNRVVEDDSAKQSGAVRVISLPQSRATSFSKADGEKTWKVLNSDRGLRASLKPGSLEVETLDGTRFGLQLQGLGYGDQLSLPTLLSESAEDSRITYARERGLEEWYVNDGARGIEQGFTLRERLGEGTGLLKIALAVDTGNLKPELSEDGCSIEICESDGEVALRYHGLIAYDSVGAMLEANMQLEGDQLLLAVNDKTAVYPIVVDPWVDVPEERLIASGSFGDLALEGNLLAVGRPNASNNRGSVFVFDAVSGEQLYELTAADGSAGDRFGSSVAISGNLLVVGAPFDSEGEIDKHGSFYLFDLTDGAQLRKRVATDYAQHQRFGTSVAIFGGGTIIIGAPGDGSYFQEATSTSSGFLRNRITRTYDRLFNGPGAAYIFGGGNTEQLQKLEAPNGQDGDEFGASVAIEDGKAMVGTYRDTVSGKNRQGSVHVFDVESAEQIHHIVPFDGAPNQSFGSDVEFSGAQGIIGSNGGAYLIDVETGDIVKLIGGPQRRVAIDGAIAIAGTSVYDLEGLGAIQELRMRQFAFLSYPVALSGNLAAISTGSSVYLYDVRDSDEDRLLDYVERDLGSDPLDVDTDEDGLHDGDEVLIHGTSPLLSDTDGDQLSDPQELETTLTNPTVADTDGDGLNDGDELLVFLTDPLLPDTDSDGLTDGEEQNTYGSDPLLADTDGDGLNDSGEVANGTNLHIPDTDVDGFTDGDEVVLSSDPRSDTSKPVVDFGDAPASYPVRLADRGAIHGLSALTLGATIDAEADGADSSAADGDDQSGGDDEDGVTVLNEPWVKGELAEIEVNVSTSSGFLQVWLDTNDDGDWEDAGEQMTIDEPVSAGINRIAFVLPIDAKVTSAMVMRVRLSSTAGLGLRGAAADGEVEDHVVETTVTDEFRLVHSADAGDRFSADIALSDTYALVGTPMDDVAGVEEAGSVIVYESTTGNFVTTLTAPDGMSDDHFGFSVAVCGFRAYVGAPGHQGTGAVYVFSLPSGDFTRKVESPSGTPEGRFGADVACDESVLVVGAPGSVSEAGGAYVFHRTGSSLLYSLTLAETQPQQNYGAQVGVSWPFVTVSAPSESDMGGHGGKGAIYVWEMDSTPGAKELRHRLEASDGQEGDFLGESLAMDGIYLVAGSRLANGPIASDQGAAYVYEVLSGTELLKLTASDAAEGAQFGKHVSLDGPFALVGSQQARVGDVVGQGKAYVYDIRDGKVVSELAASGGVAGDLFGYAGAISDGAVLMGSYGADIGTGAADLFRNFLPAVQALTLTVATAPLGAGDAYGGQPMNLGIPSAFPEGLKILIGAQPMMDFAFSNWSGNGVDATSAARTAILMDADKTVTANFEPGWEISVSPSFGGQVLVNSQSSEELAFGTRFSNGSFVSIQAIPDENYLFLGWNGDGITDSAAPATTVFMDQNRSLEPLFEEKPLRDLTVSLAPAKPEIMEPDFTVFGVDEGPFMDGTLAPIDAFTSHPEYEFSRWLGEGVTNPTAASTTVLMNQNRSLVAEFQKKAEFQQIFELRLESPMPDLNGAVTGAGFYVEGTIVTISATPDPGYVFEEWMAMGFGLPTNPMEATTTVIMDGDYSLEPRFQLNAGPGYIQWAEFTPFGPEGSRSPLEDSDGDLTNTFGEYASGSSPLTGEEFFALKPSIANDASASYLEGTLTLRSDDPDLSFFVESSSDNSSWASQSLGFDGTAWVLEAGQIQIPPGGVTMSDLGPEIHRLLFRDTQAIISGGKRFIRVRTTDLHGNEAIATPVGYSAIACLSGSDTAVSMGFQQFPAFRGVVGHGASGGEFLNVFFDDPIDAMVPSAYANHILKGIGGEVDGHIYHILDNTDMDLTLAIAEGEQTAFSEGQRFEIVPYWTLKTAFDRTINPAFHDSAGNSVFGRRSQLLTSNRVSFGTNLTAGAIYYRPVNEAWKVAFDHDPGTEVGDSADELILWPDAYFTIRHRISDPTTFFLSYGSLSPAGLRIPVVTLEDQSQDNPIGGGNASERTLADLELWESGTLVGSIGTSIFARKDSLLVYDNDSAAQLKTASAIYYFDEQAFEWRDAKLANASVDPESIIFPPGSVLILRTAASDGFTRFWKRPNQ